MLFTANIFADSYDLSKRNTTVYVTHPKAISVSSRCYYLRNERKRLKYCFLPKHYKIRIFGYILLIGIIFTQFIEDFHEERKLTVETLVWSFYGVVCCNIFVCLHHIIYIQMFDMYQL